MNLASVERRRRGRYLCFAALVSVVGAVPGFSTVEAQEQRMERMKGSSNLTALALEPLPLGEIKPAGWLKNQLRIQADGLTGHLDEFWPDIKDSGWIGGAAEGWERGPYWLDGAIPLAFVLDDASLKAKVTRWMDYIVTHQAEDGWLGPRQSKGYKKDDPWPVFVMLKAMTQYYEATGDARVIAAMQKFLRRLDALLSERALFDWGQFRWMDLVLSIHWLYDRTGEGWLLDLAAKAKTQGFDWRAHFADFKYKERVPGDKSRFETHGVNNAMAVKAGGVWYRQSHDDADRQSVFHMLEMLDTYHGQVTGVFTADEHYGGKSPSQGSELCLVVEYMFSLEALISVMGDAALGDRLELIAFNALPATFKPDMWAHQYDQQVNQVVCRVSEDRVYATNGPDANIFGLEPNYGCCTANMHQGWPKFASSLWMKTPDNGLAAVAYGPCVVNTKIEGKPVRIEVQTDYPFSDTVKIFVEAEGRMPLRLRIPAWAQGADAVVEQETPIAAKPGEFLTIDREWKGRTAVTVRLPMRTRIERRFNGGVSILRGPLVYAMPVGEYWKKIRGEEPHADWEVYPTTPWNYGVAVDEANPDVSVTFESRPVGDNPFSSEGAPVHARLKGWLVPEWIIEHSAAGPLPKSPISSTQPSTELTLIPYGSSRLRIAEFPVIGAP